MTLLTAPEVQQIATESARAAVREMLLTMGVDASDDKALVEMQKDFAHVRLWRQSVDTVRRQTFIVAVGVVVSGIAGAILLAVRGH